jgi:hypothetical protein
VKLSQSQSIWWQELATDRCAILFMWIARFDPIITHSNQCTNQDVCCVDRGLSRLPGASVLRPGSRWTTFADTSNTAPNSRLLVAGNSQDRWQLSHRLPNGGHYEAPNALEGDNVSLHDVHDRRGWTVPS